SGFRWLILFMAEYGTMFAVSGIATNLFLGGWNTGLLPKDLTDLLPGPIGYGIGNLLNVVVFMVKSFSLVFVMIWVRWTLPRLRIDQVMMTCLKYLIPISCVLVMGVSLWSLVLPAFIQAQFHWLLLVLCVLGIMLVVKELMARISAPPGTGM